MKPFPHYEPEMTWNEAYEFMSKKSGPPIKAYMVFDSDNGLLTTPPASNYYKPGFVHYDNERIFHAYSNIESLFNWSRSSSDHVYEVLVGDCNAVASMCGKPIISVEWWAETVGRYLYIGRRLESRFEIDDDNVGLWEISDGTTTWWTEKCNREDSSC